MRRVVTGLACVLVAGCGGSTHTDTPASTVRTATQPAHPSVEISLRGRDLRTVIFDQPLTLKGVVRRSGPTTPLQVRLLADGAPADSAMTGEGGSFEFTVRPRLNTTYSVAVEDTESRHVRVLALPEEQFRVEPLAPGRGVFVYEITHPTEVTLTKQPVQFYAHLSGRGRDYTRVGQAHFRRLDARRAAARATVTLRVPADDAVACVPTMIAPGFGRPPLRDCGRRKVRVPGH
jgi:hypothetical protein